MIKIVLFHLFSKHYVNALQYVLNPSKIPHGDIILGTTIAAKVIEILIIRHIILPKYIRDRCIQLSGIFKIFSEEHIPD